MNLDIVSTLILKDLSLFSKNRLYAVVTPLALIAYLRRLCTTT